MKIIDWDDRGLSEDLEGLWIVYVMNHPDPSGDRGMSADRNTVLCSLPEIFIRTRAIAKLKAYGTMAG